MRRRTFIMLLGGILALPLAARAQQSSKPPNFGFMGTSSSSAASPWVGAFVHRLHQLGLIEGSTVAIEFRWAEGGTERVAMIAAEFVRLKVDLIIISGNPQVLALKQANVFVVAGDPLGGERRETPPLRTRQNRRWGAASCVSEPFSRQFYIENIGASGPSPGYLPWQTNA
jgi:putative tryptophan/tyrosine transport system substrate-binding protein